MLFSLQADALGFLSSIHFYSSLVALFVHVKTDLCKCWFVSVSVCFSARMGAASKGMHVVIIKNHTHVMNLR